MPPLTEQKSCASPKVSVAMITYKHEKYIAQAIESVLMQETSFPVEFVIGEDCSPDGTRPIVADYARRYPNVIRPLLHPSNIGAGRNVQAVLAACKGEYIAFLEGDDYWTSSQKLQLQVRYLDKNQDCALCHHLVSYLRDETGEIVREWPPPEKRMDRPPVELLAQGHFMQTCSLVVRRSAIPELTEDFWKLKLGDWPLCVLLTERGQIGYIDQNVAVYRLHEGGVWSGSTPTNKWRSKALYEAEKFLARTVKGSRRRLWVENLLGSARQELREASREGSMTQFSSAFRGLGADLLRFAWWQSWYYLPCMAWDTIRFAKTRLSMSIAPRTGNTQSTL